MRRVAQLASVTIAGALLSGCAVHDMRSGYSVRATGSTSTTAVAAAAAPPTTSYPPRVRASVPVANLPTETAAVTSNTSPWPTFTGHIVGASHAVARVIPSAIGVSVNRGEDPLIGLSNASPLGAPRVLLIVQDAGDWLQVLLPLRPNNSLGWVRRTDVDVSSVDFRIEINRPAHRLQIFHGDNVILDQEVAVGKASTPTPGGQFFTTELLQPPNGRGAYGPYAFTLSAYSNVFQKFGSGDGAVGVHGTNDPRSLGRDASHGCVRIANETISWMAGFIPLGTPVFIQ